MMITPYPKQLFSWTTFYKQTLYTKKRPEFNPGP